MPILASRTAPGGAVGDTFGDDVVVRVFDAAAGKYGFVPRATAGDLADSAANLAARNPVADQDDGYTVKVATNGLTYVVRDGAYEVLDYEVKVADVAARDALTEMETGQRAYVDAEDRTDRYDGTNWIEGADDEALVNTYADLPDPTTVRSGKVYTVLNDPNSNLNGRHAALGADAGSNARYWDAV